MARANYPQVPEFPAVTATSISLAALKTLIARTIFAISNEESRYTLNGALLVIKAESLAMVATDGHRLSFVEKPNEVLEGISGEKRVLFRARLCRSCSSCSRLQTPKKWSLPTTSIRSSSAWAIAP
jgi:DNA polymerase-3 subunit beta